MHCLERGSSAGANLLVCRQPYVRPSPRQKQGDVGVSSAVNGSRRQVPAGPKKEAAEPSSCAYSEGDLNVFDD